MEHTQFNETTLSPLNAQHTWTLLLQLMAQTG